VLVVRVVRRIGPLEEGAVGLGGVGEWPDGHVGGRGEVGGERQLHQHRRPVQGRPLRLQRRGQGPVVGHQAVVGELVESCGGHRLCLCARGQDQQGAGEGRRVRFDACGAEGGAAGVGQLEVVHVAPLTPGRAA
jgi:hypothetical protein